MHLAAPFPAVIEACFPIIADEENDGRPRVSAINAYDRRKRTPLHRAAAAGAIESIHLLIKVGAIVDAPDLEGLGADAAAGRERVEATDMWKGFRRQVERLGGGSLPVRYEQQ